MSTTYGEKDAELTLTSAWEILGGKICDGICGYVDNIVDFEMNKGYLNIIEKKAENLYRTISQKMINLPSSNGAVTRTVSKGHHIDLTPKESELLSKHAADDSYMKKQKEDIEYLMNTIGLEALPVQLREIAQLRLENSEASLKELGNMLSSPVGKSGVNHRLRKISILADELREKKGGILQ